MLRKGSFLIIQIKKFPLNSLPRVGDEAEKQKKHLQPKAISAWFHLVAGEGFEPPTFGLWDPSSFIVTEYHQVSLSTINTTSLGYLKECNWDYILIILHRLTSLLDTYMDTYESSLTINRKRFNNAESLHSECCRIEALRLWWNAFSKLIRNSA